MSFVDAPCRTRATTSCSRAVSPARHDGHLTHLGLRRGLDRKDDRPPSAGLTGADVAADWEVPSTRPPRGMARTVSQWPVRLGTLVVVDRLVVRAEVVTARTLAGSDPWSQPPSSSTTALAPAVMSVTWPAALTMRTADPPPDRAPEAGAAKSTRRTPSAMTSSPEASSCPSPAVNGAPPSPR